MKTMLRDSAGSEKLLFLVGGELSLASSLSTVQSPAFGPPGVRIRYARWVDGVARIEVSRQLRTDLRCSGYSNS